MYFERIFKIAVSQKHVKAFVTCSTPKTVCPLESRILDTIFSGNVAGDNLLAYNDVRWKHRISTERKEKRWRYFFHQIDPNWPLPYSTVPVASTTIEGSKGYQSALIKRIAYTGRPISRLGDWFGLVLAELHKWNGDGGGGYGLHSQN